MSDFTDANPLSDMSEVLPPDAKVQLSSGTAIAALGLSMALRYHDINTVQDGTLYQQYKLEGKDMHGLHIEHVLETAKIFEAHILSAPNRMSDQIMGALLTSLESEFGSGENTDEEAPHEAIVDETVDDPTQP